MWGRVTNRISRMWVTIFGIYYEIIILSECVIEKIKNEREIIQVNNISYRKCIWIKKDKDRRKLCWNYNNNIRKCWVHWAQPNFQNANIIKAVLKLEASVTNAATYYLSSIKGNAWILLVILSLNPPPPKLQLWNEMLIQSCRLARRSQIREQLIWSEVVGYSYAVLLKRNISYEPFFWEISE